MILSFFHLPITKPHSKPFVSATVLVFLSLSSCDKGVEPFPPAKSPRDYSWTSQEISGSTFQVFATDIWGSSSQDVYATFQSGSTRTYKLLHFDGSQWSEVDIGKFGSSQVVFNLFAVTGFGPSDVWAVGERLHLNPTPPPNFLDSSLVIHFNGLSWTEVPVNPKQKGLRSIGSVSPTDIWFGGVGLSLYHYNGVSVMAESLGAVAKTQTNDLILSTMAADGSGNIYTVYHDLGYFHFLNRLGGTWRELNSQFASQTSLWVSKSGKIFSTFYGYGVYVWDGQAPWVPFYTEGNASIFMYGSSEDNLFVVGQYGGLYHYNGIDWYKFKNLESTTISFSAIWTDGKEVFVIGDDGFKSYIYHGK